MKIFSMWETDVKQSRTHMQAMHFCIAIGGSLSPIIASAFMVFRATPAPGQDINNTHINTTYINTTNVFSYSNTIHNSSLQTTVPNGKSHIQWVFVIAGVSFLVGSILYLYFYVSGMTNLNNESKGTFPDESSLPPKTPTEGFWTSFKRVPWGSLVFVLFLRYVHAAFNITTKSLMMTFAVNHLGWNKFHASLLLATFLSTVAIASLIGIVAARLFNSFQILCIDFSLMFTGSVGMMFSTFHVSVPYISVVLLACGAATCMSALMSQANSFVRLTGKLSSLVLLMTSLAEFTIPYLVGTIIQTWGPQWWARCLTLITGLGILCLIPLRYIMWVKQKQATQYREDYEKTSENTYNSFSEDMLDDLDYCMYGSSRSMKDVIVHYHPAFRKNKVSQNSYFKAIAKSRIPTKGSLI